MTTRRSARAGPADPGHALGGRHVPPVTPPPGHITRRGQLMRRPDPGRARSLTIDYAPTGSGGKTPCGIEPPGRYPPGHIGAG